MFVIVKVRFIYDINLCRHAKLRSSGSPAFRLASYSANSPSRVNQSQCVDGSGSETHLWVSPGQSAGPGSDPTIGSTHVGVLLPLEKDPAASREGKDACFACLSFAGGSGSDLWGHGCTLGQSSGQQGGYSVLGDGTRPSYSWTFLTPNNPGYVWFCWMKRAGMVINVFLLPLRMNSTICGGEPSASPSHPSPIPRGSLAPEPPETTGHRTRKSTPRRIR